ELVKVRIGTECPEDRHEVAERLGPAVKGEVAQVLGRTVLVYRRHPKEPKIKLPQGGARAPRRRPGTRSTRRRPARATFAGRMEALEAVLAGVPFLEGLRPDEIARVARRLACSTLARGERRAFAATMEEARLLIVVRGRLHLE